MAFVKNRTHQRIEQQDPDDRRALMQYVELDPPRALKGSCSVVWGVQGSPPSGFSKRFHPTGNVNVVVHGEDGGCSLLPQRQLHRSERVVTTGLQRGPFVVGLGTYTQAVVLSLTPDGAARLFGVPPRLLLKDWQYVRDLAPRSVGPLADVHRTSEGVSGRARSAIQALSTLVESGGPQTPFEAAVQLIRKGGGVRTVDDVASELGVHRRTLERIFAAELGLSPKAYSGMVRFGRAVELARRSPLPDWADIAAHAGYADQSQLTRDFRRRSGMTPGALHRYESLAASLHGPTPTPQ